MSGITVLRQMFPTKLLLVVVISCKSSGEKWKRKLENDEHENSIRNQYNFIGSCRTLSKSNREIRFLGSNYAQQVELSTDCLLETSRKIKK